MGGREGVGELGGDEEVAVCKIVVVADDGESVGAFLEEAVRHVHGDWRGGLLRAALGEGAFTAGGEVEAAEVMSVERHRAAVCVAEGERGGVAFSGDGV